jgi:hypothetical protein
VSNQRRGLVRNTPVLYSGQSGFKSRLVTACPDRLLIVFPLTHVMAAIVYRMRALPLTFKYSLIIYRMTFPSTLYYSDYGPCAGLPGFDSRHDKFSLFSTAPRLALGPTQTPIHWVPGAISPDVKPPGLEANHSPQSSAEVKNDGVIPPFPHISSWHSLIN